MDPYRVFFPLGTSMSILGILPWIGFAFGLTKNYPGLLHSDLMVGGFLFLFSAGFLMTAIPQFTGAIRCQSWELLFGVTLFFGLLATSFLDSRFWFHLLSSFSLISLVLFCMRRVLTRAYNPPRFFVFVGLGLFMGVTGSLLLALCELGRFDAEKWYALAKVIYTQGMVLSLILGVGTHLLPAIWSWSDLPVQITKLGERDHPWKVLGPVVALASVLLVSFLIEVKWNVALGLALRATLVTSLAISRWKILKKPKARGRVAFWSWVSAWALLIGLWLPVITPTHSVHGLHIAFIGGFGLMTFMVASRVTLAHGGYGHRVELRSRLLTVAAVVILAAALTRATAPLIPQAYLHHLGYAAGTWTIGVLLWSIVFIPKMIKLKN